MLKVIALVYTVQCLESLQDADISTDDEKHQQSTGKVILYPRYVRTSLLFVNIISL